MANGTFVIKSQTHNATYEYTDSVIIVQGSYVMDVETNELTSINGSCYNKNEQGGLGTYIGNFNGYMRDNEIKYSISEMSRRNASKVWDAIDDIEANITGANNAE